MIQNGQEKNAQNLDSAENSKSIRVITEAAVRGCSGENLQKNISGGVRLQ